MDAVVRKVTNKSGEIQIFNALTRINCCTVTLLKQLSEQFDYEQSA